MWLLIAACRGPGSASEPITPPGAPAPAEMALAVSSYFGDRIHLFGPETGELIGEIAGLDGPQTIVVGPDGDWIACSELENRIVRVDPGSLQVAGALVADDPGTPEDETGGLRNPDAAAFGPDGRLYVASFETDEVLRYEPDGAFVDVFVAAGAGGLSGPDIGVGFDPGGGLAVPGWYSDRIHRYDGETGEPAADLIGAGEGLDAPRAVRWDAAGAAYASGFEAGGVLRVDPGTGAVEPWIALEGAAGLAIDEERGVLYAASGIDDAVRAYDLASGEDLGILIGAGRIDGATAVELLPRPGGE